MTWKYLDVLNVCIQILLTVGLGCLFQYGRIVHAPDFIPQATKFVFYVALPCHILKGLGMEVDFYDDTLMWSYIGAFFILRAVVLVACVAWVVLLNRTRPKTAIDEDVDGIGRVAILWLAMAWISTVILGVPIAAAVFGDPSLGLKYGVLAAISSFIFQLPLELFLLECHALDRRETKSTTRITMEVSPTATAAKNGFQAEEAAPGQASETTQKDVEDGVQEDYDEIPLDAKPSTSIQEDVACAAADPLNIPAMVGTPEHDKEASAVPKSTWLQYIKRGDIWKKILWQLFRNPIIWAIIFGFILTLSTVGPRFLNPTSDDYVPSLGWVNLTITWLGACVSPLSLFAMGVWMQSEWKRLFGCNAVYSMMCYMTSKLVLVPLVMVGLAKAVNLDDQAGRAAVLIASLPISLAAFPLASRYKIGEDTLSINVALGTALVLPTILIWNLVMDELDLFPLPPS